MSGLDLFHFLRPLWLLSLPALALIWWLVRRRDADNAQSVDLFAPHLRDALTTNREVRSLIRPVDGAILGLVALVLAAAGPTWSKRPSPWFSETAPLVIAIEVSDSMRSNDMQPTRLDRARFKILDLVAQRTGSRTALIAYAGTAHIVMPPTTDINVFKPFLESLDPAIMPAGGASAAAVLPVASRLLGVDGPISTLLFVNDGFEADDIAMLAAYRAESASPATAALVVGTDDGGVALYPDGSPVTDAAGRRLVTSIDADVLRRVESESGTPVIRATSGDSDIRQLLRQVQSNLRQADDPNAQWEDRGWWVVVPAALLALLWFRRGWTMRW